MSSPYHPKRLMLMVNKQRLINYVWKCWGKSRARSWPLNEWRASHSLVYLLDDNQVFFWVKHLLRCWLATRLRTNASNVVTGGGASLFRYFLHHCKSLCYQFAAQAFSTRFWNQFASKLGCILRCATRCLRNHELVGSTTPTSQSFKPTSWLRGFRGGQISIFFTGIR